jgi:hypothetical protein
MILERNLELSQEEKIRMEAWKKQEGFYRINQV